MAFRKYRRRPYRFRRGRRFRRRIAKRRSIKSYSASFHRFKRTVLKHTLHMIAGIGDVPYAMYFKLDDLPNYTEFASLYDSYRIDKVVLHFVPTSTVAEPEGTASSSTTSMVVYNDHDDAVNPSSQADAMERQGHRLINLTNSSRGFIKHTVRPRAAMGSGNAIMTGKYQWFDCGVPTTPFYGVKLWIHQATNTNVTADCPAFTMQIYATYYLSLKTYR